MSTLLETEDYKGYTIELHYDESPSDPWREYDHCGSLVLSHRQYDFPNDAELRFEDFGSWTEVEAELRENHDAALILPVGMIDHSGISIYIGTTSPFDPQGWDSGQIGFAFLTTEKLSTEWNGDAERGEAYLRDCVKEYGDYVNGSVYGFVVKDQNDDVVDSCFGFIGESDYAMDEARSWVDFEIGYDADRLPELIGQVG